MTIGGLHRALETRGYTISLDTVERWLSDSRKGTPPLDRMGIIAEALALDSMELWLPLGLLPEHPARVVLEVIRLRERAIALETQLRLIPPPTAVGQVVQAAADHGIPVGVLPALEGNQFGRHLVAYRFTLEPANPDLPAGLVDVMSQHRLLKLARRSDGREPAHASVTNGTFKHLWSLPVHTAPRPPQRPDHRDLPQILVFALTIAAGPNDTASWIAKALGLGLHSTRDGRIAFYGAATNAKQSGIERDAVAFQVIHDPDLRIGHVWSHFSTHNTKLLDALARKRPPLSFVWLRETEALLRHHVDRTGSDLTIRQLITRQNEIEQVLANNAIKTIEVTVNEPDISGEASDSGLRDALFDQSVLSAATALRTIEMEHSITPADGRDALPAPLRTGYSS